MGLRQCLHASKLWFRAQLSKLRRRHKTDANTNGGDDNRRRHSELFRRNRDDRQKARSRTHPEASVSRSRTFMDESECETKPCAVCQRAFEPSKSKYLDFCSVECKTEAFKDKGDQETTPTRLSEWI